MNKENQQIYCRDDEPNAINNVRTTASSTKRKCLRLAWVMALCLFLASGVSVTLFSNKTSSVDSDGFLHEPLFLLVPISYCFLLVSIVLGLLDMVLVLKKRLYSP